ncbi:MAG: imidazole glycerol phosphate synthase subunit HisH [Sterolibacteriaceae bacterium MAG5]|nr:imidazole glycerol phosphate synthase subunit HisH [Candidatus Nitricoxidireducens bremensis]
MITVIDTGTANTGSVAKALNVLRIPFVLTNDPAAVAGACKLLLPGVGAFEAGMTALRMRGLIDPLVEAVGFRKTPILGICLGMQLLVSDSEEHGFHRGLGLVSGRVRKLDATLCPTVPHMGWNNLESTDGNPLLRGMGTGPNFYFVHGFHVMDLGADVNVSVTHFGTQRIVATFNVGNIYGVQFHPEKSQKNGLTLLKNFADYA